MACFSGRCHVKPHMDSDTSPPAQSHRGMASHTRSLRCGQRSATVMSTLQAAHSSAPSTPAKRGPHLS